jgi:hypothetical protein
VDSVRLFINLMEIARLRPDLQNAISNSGPSLSPALLTQPQKYHDSSESIASRCSPLHRDLRNTIPHISLRNKTTTQTDAWSGHCMMSSIETLFRLNGSCLATPISRTIPRALYAPLDTDGTSNTLPHTNLLVIPLRGCHREQKKLITCIIPPHPLAPTWKITHPDAYVICDYRSMQLTSRRRS